jgi:dTDP-4-dehydrorhamnose 3,5-epimerase
MNKRFIFTKIRKPKSHSVTRKKIKDFRGYFERLYCEKEFIKLLKKKNIKQINRSYTKKRGTIRGMHYQIGGRLEDKIVTCIKGKVFDVIIDIRKESKNFLRWYGKILDSNSTYSNFVPYGFAHGYQTLTKDCEVLYFHTDFYSKKRSKVINCLDTKICIKWPIKNRQITSKKDKNMNFLNDKFIGI